MRSDAPRRALVLAGGRGRRLEPFTAVFPKPLAPVGDQPVVEILLRQLAAQGCTEAILSIGHLGELVQAYFSARGAPDGLALSYLRETTPLGTAGPLTLLDPLEDDLLVVNGDLLTTLDFGALVADHRADGAALTIAVQARETTIDFGVVDLGEAGAVTGWTEKPSLAHFCSMGAYVVAPRALAGLERPSALDMPDLVLRVLDGGGRVHAHVSDAYWLDIGRREDYERAQVDVERLRDQLLPDR